MEAFFHDAPDPIEKYARAWLNRTQREIMTVQDDKRLRSMHIPGSSSLGCFSCLAQSFCVALYFSASLYIIFALQLSPSLYTSLCFVCLCLRYDRKRTVLKDNPKGGRSLSTRTKLGSSEHNIFHGIVTLLALAQGTRRRRSRQTRAPEPPAARACNTLFCTAKQGTCKHAHARQTVVLRVIRYSLMIVTK